MVIIFSQNPHLIISGTETRLLAKTTVFGPVAAGIIKAKEHATVAGIIKSNGFIFAAKAVLANIGSRIFALAVLELNSVNIKTNAIITIRMVKKEKLLTKVS